GDARENIHAAMPTLLHLSEAQRTERLRNLPHLRYRYRSGWGLSMLKGAGYLDSPVRGIWRITERGRQLISSHPNGFSERVGREIIRASRKADQAQQTAEEVLADAPASTTGQVPDEQI